MLITRTSMLSNVTRTLDINVTQEQLDAWIVDGVLIQNAMPHLSADEREFMLTGIWDDDWVEEYYEEEEDDDEEFDIEEDDGYDHEDDYFEDDYDHDDDRSAREKETHDRLDMGRNEAGEWLGFM